MMFSFRSARPGRGRGTSSRSTPPPKVLSKKEIQQKQENLIHSLREAETKQLTDYLKNRSSILDQEIQQTREKLNLNLSSSSPNPRLSIHPREREREPRSPGIWKDPAKGKKNEDNDIEHYEKEEYQLKYLLKRLLQCKKIKYSTHFSHLLRYGGFSHDAGSDYIMLFTITAFEI